MIGHRSRAVLSAAFFSLVLIVSLAPAVRTHAATPGFVQEAENGVSSGKTVSKAFSKATTSGNLIVAYLVWSNTSTATLSDSAGDTYTAATARTTWNNWSSQVFYASNINKATDTVTATLATSVSSFALLYIHEYSGLSAANPVDVTSTASGTAKAMSSGSATTTNANDLIFAGGASNSSVTAGGTGYTVRSYGYGNVTQDKTVATTGSYSATATQGGQAWVLQMVAFKAGATTTDTTPPTAPGNLTASSAGQTQAQLSWSASNDNIGVTGYNVYRSTTNGFTPSASNKLVTVTTTGYTDSGLSAGTTYYYVVTASDAAGNTSASSNQASLAVTDTTAPSVPSNLSASAASTAAINLTWAASSDNVAVTGYQLYRNGSLIATPTAASYQDTGLSAATTYSYTVAATDAAGNVSGQSTAVSATTLAAADTTAPTTPTNLVATPSSSTSIGLSWSASTDDTAVTDYDVYRNGAFIKSVSGTTYTDTGLTPATLYTYTVDARDAAGNVSAPTSSVSVSTPADTTAPSVPSNLSASAASSSTVNLSWGTSTDNIGVTGYQLYRNGSLVATTTGTSYQDTGLSASTSYSYTVAATDAAGNVSGQSSAVNVTTPSNLAPINGKLVSLGDSYTSGYGAGPYTSASGGCYISQSHAYVNYAATQLSALGGTVTEANYGCAGATTSDTAEGGLAVVAGAKWVAMTDGGNDYDFIDDLMEGSAGLQSITSHQAQVTAGVVNVINVAKQSAPNAQYYVFGYPDLMPPTGTNISSCFGSDASSVNLSLDHQMYTVIDQALQNAATQAGATYIETTSHFVGHDMCSGSSSWFTPYGEADEWHPVAAGQQELGTLLAQAIEANN